MSDADQLIDVNTVLSGTLTEGDVLTEQAGKNSKQQSANTPDLRRAIPDKDFGAFEAHTTISKQALDAERARKGRPAGRACHRAAGPRGRSSDHRQGL